MPGKIVVLGGGGFVGAVLVGRLATRGNAVIVPARRPEARKALRLLPGVQVLGADLGDPRQLAALFAGAQAVINLVGILHDRDPALPYGRRFAAAHVDLPRRVLAAMREVGVRRLLQMSALCAAPDAPSAYLRSKAAGEALVLEARGDLAVTVFRPSVIFGPGDKFLNTFAALARHVPVLPIAGAETRFQPVYVGDVAEAFVQALDLPQTAGRIYELCGPHVLSLRQLVAYAAQHSGHPRPVWAVPPWLARVQAALLGCLPDPPMTPDNLRSLTVDNVASGLPPFPDWHPVPLAAVVSAILGGQTPRARYDALRRGGPR